ncbi:unnamed protein product, partial [Candidula unifasciata]
SNWPKKRRHSLGCQLQLTTPSHQKLSSWVLVVTVPILATSSTAAVVLTSLTPPSSTTLISARITTSRIITIITTMTGATLQGWRMIMAHIRMLLALS